MGGSRLGVQGADVATRFRISLSGPQSFEIRSAVTAQDVLFGLATYTRPATKSSQVTGKFGGSDIRLWCERYGRQSWRIALEGQVLTSDSGCVLRGRIGTIRESRIGGVLLPLLAMSAALWVYSATSSAVTALPFGLFAVLFLFLPVLNWRRGVWEAAVIADLIGREMQADAVGPILGALGETHRPEKKPGSL